MAADRIIYKFVELDDVIAASPGANKLVYLTSASAIATTSFSSFGRSLIDDADAATARTTLGLGASSDVAFGTVTANSATFDDISCLNSLGANALSADHLTLTPASAAGITIQPLDDTNTANLITAKTWQGTTLLSLSYLGVLTGNGSGLTSLNASNISSGTLPVTRGGTGITSVTTGNVLYATGSNTLAAGSPDTAGLVAKSGTQTGIAGDKTCTGAWTFPSGAQIKSNGAFYTNVDFEITNAVYIGGANSNYAGTYGIRWASGSNAFLGQEDTLLGRAAAAIICITDNNTTGNPGLAIQAKSSTTNQRDRIRLTTDAASNVDASRQYNAYFDVYNTAACRALSMHAPSSGTQATIAIGGGTQFKQVLSATATLDFASIAAGAQGELTITVTGAATGDVVMLGPPAALDSGLSATGYVSAADTVKVRLVNSTSGSIDPASAAWRVAVIKF